MENMETTLKRRLSDEYSLRSSDNDVEDVPADVAAFRDRQKHGFAPTHENGRSTPCHIVEKPIHDSPKDDHQEIPAETPAVHPPGRPSQSQEAVIKIVEAKVSADTLVEPLLRLPGSEPGIDPRRESVKRAYAYIHEECEIEVIDYDSRHVKFQQFDNESFLQFLNKTEPTPPMKVRWINIAGISWDIISDLAIKYQLHPLAIEDILHSKSTTRSKADYYPRHLFLSVLCHSVSSKKSSPLDAKYFREESAETESDPDSDETDTEDENQTDEQPEEDTKKTLLRRVTRRGRKRRSRTMDPEAAKNAERHTPLKWSETIAFLNPESRRRQAQIARLNALKKRDRVRVHVSNAFFFLFKDGTLISIHQGDRSFGNQIYHRLRHADTVLRKEQDGSLLLQALLDLIVDQAIQVVEKYSDKINETETQVLIKPNVNIVRTLHILSADLSLRKRSMQPLKPLIWGLRKFDLERTAAALGANHQGPVEGFMSPKTKVYLSDVSDHLEGILSSLDQFATTSDSLIDLTFNLNAHNTNEQMKRMTLLMIIFLPLTFATGYFGMNFAVFPVVQEHSDLLFWQIVLPVMAVVMPWALWSDIRRMFRMIGRIRLLNRVEQKQNAKVKTAERRERVLRRRTMAAKEKAT